MATLAVEVQVTERTAPLLVAIRKAESFRPNDHDAPGSVRTSIGTIDPSPSDPTKPRRASSGLNSTANVSASEMSALMITSGLVMTLASFRPAVSAALRAHLIAVDKPVNALARDCSCSAIASDQPHPESKV